MLNYILKSLLIIDCIKKSSMERMGDKYGENIS